MTGRYFITFEGPEGSGKSTQIKKLQNFFAEKGFETLVSREPGGTRPGDAIREVLISKLSGKLEAETEMFLMLAQRCEHLRIDILILALLIRDMAEVWEQKKFVRLMKNF